VDNPKKQAMRKKGIQQVQANYVLKLSQKGMPVEDIAELVDLSAEEVNNILNKNDYLCT
jgi:predicted transposase YdaD